MRWDLWLYGMREVCGVFLEDLMGGVFEGKGVCGVGFLSVGRM